MNREEAEKFADKMLVAAKTNLVKCKHLTPVAFVVEPDGKTNIVGMVFESRENKYVMFKKLSESARLVKAQVIITMVDAWYRRLEKDQKLEDYKMPERGIVDDPLRCEGIAVTFMGPAIDRPRSKMIPYKRELDDKCIEHIVFLDEEDEGKWNDAEVFLIPEWWGPQSNAANN